MSPNSLVNEEEMIAEANSKAQGLMLEALSLHAQVEPQAVIDFPTKFGGKIINVENEQALLEKELAFVTNLQKTKPDTKGLQDMSGEMIKTINDSAGNQSRVTELEEERSAIYQEQSARFKKLTQLREDHKNGTGNVSEDAVKIFEKQHGRLREREGALNEKINDEITRLPVLDIKEAALLGRKIELLDELAKTPEKNQEILENASKRLEGQLDENSNSQQVGRVINHNQKLTAKFSEDVKRDRSQGPQANKINFYSHLAVACLENGDEHSFLAVATALTQAYKPDDLPALEKIDNQLPDRLKDIKLRSNATYKFERPENLTITVPYMGRALSKVEHTEKKDYESLRDGLELKRLKMLELEKKKKSPSELEEGKSLNDFAALAEELRMARLKQENNPKVEAEQKTRENQEKKNKKQEKGKRNKEKEKKKEGKQKAKSEPTSSASKKGPLSSLFSRMRSSSSEKKEPAPSSSSSSQPPAPTLQNLAATLNQGAPHEHEEKPSLKGSNEENDWQSSPSHSSQQSSPRSPPLFQFSRAQQSTEQVASPASSPQSSPPSSFSQAPPPLTGQVASPASSSQSSPPSPKQSQSFLPGLKRHADKNQKEEGFMGQSRPQQSPPPLAPASPSSKSTLADMKENLPPPLSSAASSTSPSGSSPASPSTSQENQTKKESDQTKNESDRPPRPPRPPRRPG